PWRPIPQYILFNSKLRANPVPPGKVGLLPGLPQRRECTAIAGTPTAPRPRIETPPATRGQKRPGKTATRQVGVIAPDSVPQLNDCVAWCSPLFARPVTQFGAGSWYPLRLFRGSRQD